MAKPKETFDPRRLMEQAVEVMHKSRAEVRTDGKATPKVGAVLWDPEGGSQTAHRGELREGDHAEYTLLERKNRDRSLEKCKLFATLEPCAPAARKFPKLGCAERIVNARIKEVWIGIEDPDPTVARKGIEHLRGAGITVHMFDRDLQEQIRKENKLFLDQAEARAKAVKDEPSQPVALSSMESPLDRLSHSSFSVPALQQFKEALGLKSAANSDTFLNALVSRGLAAKVGKKFVPTGFGLLLFGKEPRATLPQAGLLATIEYPDGHKETEDFQGPLSLLPDALEKWLRAKLPNVIDRSAMRRSRVPPLPFEMVREAVVNALVHRDYDIKGAKCQLIVTADTITVRSPGASVPPITLEQLQSFNAPMLSRNPGLHYVFAQLDLAEERGLGLRSLKELAQKLDLPLPTYRWNNPYLDLVIYRSPAAAVNILPDRIVKQLSDGEQAGWQWFKARGTAKSSEYAKAQSLADRVARRHLNHFVDLRLAKKLGAGPSTTYSVIS